MPHAEQMNSAKLMENALMDDANAKKDWSGEKTVVLVRNLYF